MTDPIRPKVSETIKQIAASDERGKSKAQIDTHKEYQNLKDYLAGNVEELKPSEKEQINHLLQKAKEYLKDVTGKEPSGAEDVKMEQANKLAPGTEETEQNYEHSTSEDVKMEQANKLAPGTEETKQNYEHSTSEDVKMEQANKPAPGTEETKQNSKSSGSEEVKGREQVNGGKKDERKGEKVLIDGKLCIKMPSGAIYDALTGRKIK